MQAEPVCNEKISSHARAAQQPGDQPAGPPVQRPLADGVHLQPRGFSLLELLLVLVVVGVLSGFAITMTQSVREVAAGSETKTRMQAIVSQAKEYYQDHGFLPAALASPANGVPVEGPAFNMETKYMLDGWGRHLQYWTMPGLIVNGRAVAAVLVSGGPDQLITAAPVANTDYTAAGDDLVMAVNLNREQMTIAHEELRVLQDAVLAFDRQFAGVDNDGDQDDNGTGSGLDEDGPVRMTPVGNLCPPTNANNDPSGGRATLSDISNGGYSCDGIGLASAYELIRQFYGLSPTVYDSDPWGNGYLWDSGLEKFHSAGPDGVGGNGDDVYP